jgi:predicted membrane channel-forming protein YqfA (hemolysin III family)
MRAPPAKPFAITFVAILLIFIVWAIVGSVLESTVNGPDHDKIARIAMPVAFTLFLIMGFSAVPVMARLFFKGFFGIQKATGGMEQPAVQKLHQQSETLAAIFVYGIWILFGLGTLIAAPFFLHDMMSGP